MRIAMRPRNALGYRRHPFRQHGDIDHTHRVRFPNLHQQLSAGTIAVALRSVWSTILWHTVADELFN
jgi:hypothetical protein